MFIVKSIDLVDGTTKIVCATRTYDGAKLYISDMKKTLGKQEKYYQYVVERVPLENKELL